jgi:hypothetical protein
MIRQPLMLLMGFVVVLLSASSSWGWNDAGHLTISRIAWDIISVDQRESIVTILRQHPHRDSLLLKDRPPEATEAEWMFLRAGVWADLVRPPKEFPREDVDRHPLYKFHRGTWHYVNFPYQQGQRSSALPEQPLPGNTNILRQLDQSMKVLLGPDQTDADRVGDVNEQQNRAIRLTWLFHLVEDLHQPLHSVALVDERLFPDPPHTDQGGNKLAIRADSSSKVKNLHWLWDEMFSTDAHFSHVCQNAERLLHDPSLNPERLTELVRHPKFRDWAAESYEAAIANAYQNLELKLVLWDDFQAGRIPEDEVPTLPLSALQKARLIAERRIILAGHRLAAKLKDVARK